MLKAEGQCRQELNSVKKKLEAAKGENDALRKKLESSPSGPNVCALEEVVSLQKQVIALMEALPDKSVPVQSQIDEMRKTLGPASSSELRSALTQARSAISMAMKEMQQQHEGPGSSELQEELERQREEVKALREQLQAEKERLRTAVDQVKRGSEIAFERKLSSEQEMRERAEKVAIGASQTLEMKVRCWLGVDVRR